MNMNPEYTPARKPYALLPGLTVIFGAEGCDGNGSYAPDALQSIAASGSATLGTEGSAESSRTMHGMLRPARCDSQNPAAGSPSLQEQGRVHKAGRACAPAQRRDCYYVDIEADEFARLFGAENTGDMNAVERLSRALKRAAFFSALHICDDDGGTCNFDSPVLDYAACSMSKADAEAAIKAVGLHCHDWKPFRNHRGDDGKLVVAPTYLVISGFQSGQGLRRTRMAEAFCQQLNEDGFEAGMYYQMD